MLATGANNRDQMNFTRPDLQDDLTRLRAERRPSRRAMGDNFLFEENVGSDRLADFERFPALAPGLLPTASDYFFAFTEVPRSRTIRLHAIPL